jgi:hypothetical protein
MLFQSSDMTEEQQQEHLNGIYQKLAELQVELFMLSIASVTTPEGVVEDRDQIREWLRNTERPIYNTIKEQLEKNKAAWTIPKQPVTCSECGTPDTFEITMDQSNFFG